MFAVRRVYDMLADRFAAVRAKARQRQEDMNYRRQRARPRKGRINSDHHDDTYAAWLQDGNYNQRTVFKRCGFTHVGSKMKSSKLK